MAKNCKRRCKMKGRGRDEETERLAAHEALGKLPDVARRYTGVRLRRKPFAGRAPKKTAAGSPTDPGESRPALPMTCWRCFTLVGDCNRYPNDIGFEEEIKAVWKLWKANRTEGKQIPA